MSSVKGIGFHENDRFPLRTETYTPPKNIVVNLSYFTWTILMQFDRLKYYKTIQSWLISFTRSNISIDE